MYELSQNERDAITNQLFDKTVCWLRRYRHFPANDVLWMYFLEAKNGTLKEIYASLIDHSMDRQMSFLPVLSNRLSPEMAKIISLSRLKTQMLMNMIIYWLVLYHSGKSAELPEPDESRDIISGLMGRQLAK